jgi:hypothetical protein
MIGWYHKECYIFILLNPSSFSKHKTFKECSLLIVFDKYINLGSIKFETLMK